MTCVEKDLFFNAVEMPAHQWRTTVRALLRVDIYGHEQGGFKHKGLKDLVADITDRQKRRHEWLETQGLDGSSLGCVLFLLLICHTIERHL